MSEKNPTTPDTSIVYAVQYQTVESKDDDWYEMSGRDHNQPYEHPPIGGSSYETSDMDEAVDTAVALSTRRAHPKDPRGPYYRRVTRSRVVVRVYTGHVAAVYEAD